MNQTSAQPMLSVAYNGAKIDITEALGGASDSRPEGLGLMPVSPNTLLVQKEYVLVKLVGLKFLWAVAAETTSAGVGEYFPPLQFHA
ncbi:hypothetical protein TNCV_3450461 [Trichonephila clavipes]|uniref:Uncharacterized protein n=1 Tax=Trichonephila clavipes TaxID=2585209 RepID=A0A8X6WJM4_TRICX|nr:hypothetical protein TNCV_3450461 [Trichonephila clavipes]